MFDRVHEDWVSGQKNTFTKWANSHLQEVDLVVNDLFEDFKDGLKLIALLQCISGQPLGRKYTKKPKLRIQKMENLNLCFDFMKEQGLVTTNISSSDILDGNNKLVLGLMWIIILRFQVTTIAVDGVSGKEGLLLWCQRSLANYSNVKMTNFTSSWSNGLAFCGLIHRYHPHLLDYKSLTSDNAEDNMILAFRTAEEEFGIPQLIDVNDVANNPKPDDKIIVTYVSALFNEFASGMQKDKAVATIVRAINITQRHETLKTSYTTSAEDLSAWTTSEIAKLEHRSSFGSVKEIQEALAEVAQFKKTTLPPRDEQFYALESCAARWVASSHMNNRPDPAIEAQVAEIQRNKAKLTSMVNDYQSELRKELERFQSMELTLTTVKTLGFKLEKWLTEKEEMLDASASLENLSSTNEVEQQQQKYRFFVSHESPRYRKILEKLVTTGEILSPEHAETEATKTWMKDIETRFGAVEEKAGSYGEELEAKLAQQQQLDIVMKECNELMQKLRSNLEELEEELETPVSSTVSLDACKASFDEQVAPKFQSMIQYIHSELQEKVSMLEAGGRSLGSTLEQLNAKVTDMLQRRDTMRKELEDSIASQENIDRMYKDFAEQSSSLKQECETLTKKVHAEDENLVKQLESLKLELRAFNASSQEMLEATSDSSNTIGVLLSDLEHLNSELEAQLAFYNPYTSDTLPILRALVSSLGKALTDKIESLEKEIAQQEAGNISPEQLAEIKEVFDHFDKNKDGWISQQEFVSACAGLGLVHSKEELVALFASLDINSDDELDFQEFSKFCASQFESGSSEADVRAAFETFGSKTAIASADISKYFEQELATYMLDRMDQVPVDGADETSYDRDHQTFVTTLFSI